MTTSIETVNAELGRFVSDANGPRAPRMLGYSRWHAALVLAMLSVGCGAVAKPAPVMAPVLIGSALPKIAPARVVFPVSGERVDCPRETDRQEAR